jgi:hypothetical protein
MANKGVHSRSVKNRMSGTSRKKPIASTPREIAIAKVVATETDALAKSRTKINLSCQ